MSTTLALFPLTGVSSSRRSRSWTVTLEAKDFFFTQERSTVKKRKHWGQYWMARIFAPEFVQRGITRSDRASEVFYKSRG